MLFIVTLILSITANSQQVRSSIFHLNEIEYNNDIIRAVSPNEIVVKTSSGEGTAFAFITNSTVQCYVSVPQGYTVNDFEVLDGYIYFCGKKVNENKGCIGMLNIFSPNQLFGLCKITTIEKSKNLTKLVAYNGPVASTVGIAAIGEPEDATYTSCIVDFNNYNQSNSWKYSVGLSTKDYITDITLVAPNELATIGREKTEYVFGNLLNVNRMCVRTYKRTAMFTSGTANGVYCFQGLGTNNSNATYLAAQVDESNIAVVKATAGGTFVSGGVTTASGISLTNSIGIRIINIPTMIMVKEQTIDTTGNQIKDMVYFPNSKRLGIVSSLNDGFGEVYFPNLSKDADYTAFKLFRDDTYLNSIARFNDDSFIMTSFINANISPILTQFIHENVNDYKESSCTSDAKIRVSTVVENIIPTYLENPLEVTGYNINFSTYTVTATETEAILDCTSYYKQ